MGKFLKLEPGKSVTLFEKNKIELEDMQSIVGGYIEHVYANRTFEKNNIDIWLNEEGKLNKLTPTIILKNENEIVDVFVGTILFTSVNDEGETIPLNDEQIKIVSEELKDTSYISDGIKSYKVYILRYK